MRTEGFQRAIGKPFGRARRRETFCICKNAYKTCKKNDKIFCQRAGKSAIQRIAAGCQKTPGRRRRGRSPFDFHSYPPALPAGRVVDFACKINSLQLRTTSGWPKLLSQKSGGATFLTRCRYPKDSGSFLVIAGTFFITALDVSYGWCIICIVLLYTILHICKSYGGRSNP